MDIHPYFREIRGKRKTNGLEYQYENLTENSFAEVNNIQTM